jgi:fructosamine-3-kinase
LIGPETLSGKISDHLQCPIVHIKQLSGGCSYPAFVAESEKQSFFVKWNPNPSPVFLQEAEGLQQLRMRSDLFPAVLHYDPEMLILDHIQTESPNENFWKALGAGLAHLHLQTEETFGWNKNNFIGLSEQSNMASSHMSWPEFFWQRRVAFKLGQLQEKGQLSEAPDRLAKLRDRCFALLDDHACSASPLHGDLWNGNVLCGPNQRPYLIDPAFYFGDRETDLAMTECFGGFAPTFYLAYQETWPLPPGYEKRKHLYNLYHMLNHQVIFGSQYQRVVSQIIDQLITE